MDSPKSTPLADSHVAMGGRMVEFAGFLMPVQYQGIMAEALAVRSGAGMFDVSHMARLKFQGTRVEEYLEWVTTNDVSSLSPGQSQYSMLPNQTGGVVDDIIVTKISQDQYRMVVNASRHQQDLQHLADQNQFGVERQDVTDETVMIAVQGPKAVSLVAGLSDREQEVLGLPFFGSMDMEAAGIPCFATRSGYTGEDGLELICSADQGPKLWGALAEAGVVPCGLGSRDTLRVEAGLPLYGHELAEDLSPLEAGLGWVISKTKSFLGSAAIAKVRAEGPARRLMGLRLPGKRLTAPGMEVFVGGDPVGVISSGVISPHLECGIAFAFLRPDVKQGTAAEILIRGKMEPCQVVNKRFLKPAPTKSG
jgi:aminomethyltransferase